MKIDANPQEVVEILSSKIGQLSKENAFFMASLMEKDKKIEELEKKLESKE